MCKEFIVHHYEKMIETKKFKEFITAENSDILLEIMNEHAKLTEKKMKEHVAKKRKSGPGNWTLIPRGALKVKK